MMEVMRTNLRISMNPILRRRIPILITVGTLNCTITTWWDTMGKIQGILFGTLVLRMINVKRRGNFFYMKPSLFNLWTSLQKGWVIHKNPLPPLENLSRPPPHLKFTTMVLLM